jgi:uncharacterized protein (TIGR02594 family)
MVELSLCRRSLVALAFCSAAIAASVSPASAKSHHVRSHQVRSHHATGRYAHTRHGHHLARAHSWNRRSRYAVRGSRWERGVAEMRSRGLADTQASLMQANLMSGTASNGAMPGGFGSQGLVSEARRYLGGNPTSRRSLWCARFMNMVLEHTGHRGTGSDMANSFAHYGQRISGPQVGAIAVMGRRGGGHVGIITGIDAHGNPIMISGNNGNRVREAPVSRRRIYSYVMPN